MNTRKKWLWSGAGLLGALVLVSFGFRSVAAAETPDQTPDRLTHMERRQAMLEKGAKQLGISSDDLRAEIKSGKPFYQIAAEHGMTYDKIRAEHLQEMQSRLDEMVKVGYMTQDQANEIYEHMESDPQMGMMPVGPHGGGFMMKF